MLVSSKYWLLLLFDSYLEVMQILLDRLIFCLIKLHIVTQMCGAK